MNTEQEPRPTPGGFSSYRSVPTTVSAARFTDETKDRVFLSLTGQHAACTEDGQPILKVKTVHGETAIVRLGDWIVEDSVLGTYYPVKHDVFERKYLQPPVPALTPEQVERARKIIAHYDNYTSRGAMVFATERQTLQLLREVVGHE